MIKPCCPCSTETADERYARWDREKATGRAAALANPDTWISVSDVVEDAGDVGGDRQAGPAWSRKFIRWMPSIGKWGVINDAYYQAGEDHGGTGGEFVDRQTEYMIVGDPDQPGDTEEWSDYIYETVNTEPARTDFDTYAKELVTDSKAKDYPDPVNVVPSWVFTS
jgi:hypothetical protein